MATTILITPNEIEESRKHTFVREMSGEIVYNVAVVTCYICCRLLLVFDSSMNRIDVVQEILAKNWTQEQDNWCCPNCSDVYDDNED